MSDLFETSAEENSSQISVVDANCDSNAQFPSPDHVLRETPAYIFSNLMSSQSDVSETSHEENTKADAAVQTDITFPEYLPEVMQNILNIYADNPEPYDLSLENEEEEMNDEPNAFEFLQQQQFDFDLPSPPFSDFDCQLVEPQDYMGENPNIVADVDITDSDHEI
ncbi:PREDICTED: uncharacterized protein LOC106113662 [Papilio xuthus]|uniref:Uncharacterized protein LOC106113662 n=1 Tax=Papilio xuthus TaxID=66420 RepID=A0A194PNL5_PAPXU|nr:PREDICTED: uncharacterized protein LOC106113662 [Papilio xuthus]KPI94334.1 hypothetical protein RR46_04402 [Papilio xuthus]